LNKILVVDDDPNITFTFKKILEKEGYEVDTYTDPTKAEESFQPAVYDVALIDIRMPKMNGFELYRRIRKQDSEVKVCFVTAYEISKEEEGSPTVNGSVTFLKKPIGMQELIENVFNMVSA
jgi:two-component system response regulator ChvI